MGERSSRDLQSQGSHLTSGHLLSPSGSTKVPASPAASRFVAAPPLPRQPCLVAARALCRRGSHMTITITLTMTITITIITPNNQKP